MKGVPRHEHIFISALAMISIGLPQRILFDSKLQRFKISYAQSKKHSAGYFSRERSKLE